MIYLDIAIGLLVFMAALLSRGLVFDMIGRVLGQSEFYRTSRRVNGAILFAGLTIFIWVIIANEVTFLPVQLVALGIMISLLVIAGLGATVIRVEWENNRRK